jgi:CBS domain-containing protein
MRVEQLMTREVFTCGPDEGLDRAARIMWEHDCGFVPVVEDATSRRVVGVVTDRDVCLASFSRGQLLAEIRLGDVMTTWVRSCRPTDDLAVAEQTMREAQVHRLPVVDAHERLLGVISLGDIAREVAREVGSRQHDVSSSEVGETLSRIAQAREIAAGGSSDR